MQVKTALISASDKTGLVDLVKKLLGLEITCYATEGTRNWLDQNDVTVNSLDTYIGKNTKFVKDRVKSLSWLLHSAIAVQRDSLNEMKQFSHTGVAPIDLVVCNFYPLKTKTVEAKSVEAKDMDTKNIETIFSSIDVGGPTLLRNAARSFKDVVPVASPSLYDSLLSELYYNDCKVSYEKRLIFAQSAIEATATYDQQIMREITNNKCQEINDKKCQGMNSNEFPLINDNSLSCTKLRYGENSHQKGFWLNRQKDSGFGSLVQLNGKELSYNNIADSSQAYTIVNSFKLPSAVVVKHCIPCGLAVSRPHYTKREMTDALMTDAEMTEQLPTIAKTLSQALYGDFQSAFGGIIAINKTFTKDCADLLIKSKLFVEVIIAPNFDKGALNLLKKRKKLRLLKIKMSMDNPESSTCIINHTIQEFSLVKTIEDGYLIQDHLCLEQDFKMIKAGKANIKANDNFDLELAFKSAGFAKSNAITIVNNGVLVGVGSGQSSRIDSVKMAIKKAGKRAKDAVMASDGFFPFADSIEIARDAGIRGIIQPGGSIRDKEVTSAADKAGIYMIHTGVRLFSH